MIRDSFLGVVDECVSAQMSVSSHCLEEAAWGLARIRSPNLGLSWIQRKEEMEPGPGCGVGQGVEGE